MKKILLLLVTILLVCCISGCGTKSVEDIQGQYTNAKEVLKDGQLKSYYITVLDKDTYFSNEPAVKLNFIVKRHNDDLNKDYYVVNLYYLNKKNYELKNELGVIVGKFNPDNGDILLNDVNYNYKDKTVPNTEETKYTMDTLFSNLMDANLPKYQDSYDHTPDPVRVRQAIYY